jgi:molecular chaperone DnaK
MSDTIGIDLGTTNSAVAIWRDGKPELIPDTEGYYLTPSIVAFDPDKDEWVVGRPAKLLAQQDPRWAVKSIKRFMGRRFKGNDIQEEVAKLHVLYKVEGSNRREGGLDVVLGEYHLTPQEISARILQKLKADAETYLHQPVTEAVITVPAYFNAAQRQATHDAGRIAGLEVKQVLNEPTAAYLAFGYSQLDEERRLDKERRTVAAYDLGGGTFDISILDVGRGPFSVQATNGDTLLGGDDLDWLIVDWVIAQLDSPDQAHLADDFIAQARLWAAAEQAKIELSKAEEALVQVPGELSPNFGLHDLAVVLNRTQLEGLAETFVAKTLEPCQRALDDAGIEISEIKEVLLIGGQTRMPAIRRAVKNFFGIEPNVSVNPEKVVALGAAVQAAVLDKKTTGIALLDVVPLTLGLRTQGGLMDALIQRNTRVPIRKTKMYTTTTDDQDSVEIQVYQGERPNVADNVKLGSFILSGIEPAPAGQPEIKVTFQVDSNGILHVTGEDLYTGQARKIAITDSIKLSDDEIKAMIRHAEEHALEYATKRRRLEQQQHADQLLGRLNQLIAEKGTNLPADLIAAIQAAQIPPVSEQLESYLTTLRDLWHQLNEVGQSKE